MHRELLGISEARAWPEYYSAYQAAIHSVVCGRWGLGVASAAGHVHHLAIPDVSGQINGVSWAAYTQPSAETPVAALPLFADLLRREPARITGNRYVFFVERGKLPQWSEVVSLFGDIANVIRLSIRSIEVELDRSEWQGPLVGALAIGAGRLLPDLEEQLKTSEEPTNLIGKVAATLATQQGLDVDDRILVGGALVLGGYRARIGVSSLVEMVGQSAWLFGTAALVRAMESSWSTGAAEFCKLVRDAREVTFDEYVVQPGDILGRVIRSKYNVPFERLWPTIRAANPDISDPNKIRSGQKVRLPKI